MHALVLLCINQYTKSEAPSFTNYKDMIGAKLKKNGRFLGGPDKWTVARPLRYAYH